MELNGIELWIGKSPWISAATTNQSSASQRSKFFLAYPLVN